MKILESNTLYLYAYLANKADSDFDSDAWTKVPEQLPNRPCDEIANVVKLAV